MENGVPVVVFASEGLLVLSFNIEGDAAWVSSENGNGEGKEGEESVDNEFPFLDFFGAEFYRG